MDVAGFDSKKQWASVTIYNEIKSHSENKEKLPDDFWEDFNFFSKKYCADPNNIFYIDKSLDYPPLELAIKKVKECGGLVFYPHLFIYGWAKDKKEMINELLKKYPSDGIECMHSEFSEDEINYMINLCNKKNYFKSGGSDYHGTRKINVSMATGKGNLEIEEKLIYDWINKNKLL